MPLLYDALLRVLELRAVGRFCLRAAMLEPWIVEAKSSGEPVWMWIASMLLAKLLVDEFLRVNTSSPKVGASYSEGPTLSFRSLWPGDDKTACAETFECWYMSDCEKAGPWPFGPQNGSAASDAEAWGRLYGGSKRSSVSFAGFMSAPESWLSVHPENMEVMEATDDTLGSVDDCVVPVDCVPEKGEASDEMDPALFCTSAGAPVLSAAAYCR